ncbi:MAG: class I SAM-dependent methyltransferase [Solirubrobacteraceae bacterium]
MPDVDTPRYVQRDQPDGVPPLELTGERTLPDVPEENYWYRRHLVVYEWIADRVATRAVAAQQGTARKGAGADVRVVDLACGEGYGSAVLARRATHVVGVDANPEAHEHARLRYVADNLRFDRDLVETWEGDVDVVVFLQTIEHVQDPDALLARLATLAGPDGEVIVSTPNLLTLAPEGAEKSENPWHIKEYRAGEYRELLERHFSHVEIHGLFHARKLALHQTAIERLGWDRVHKALRLTKPFYAWFTPAIATSDFALRRPEDGADLDRALDFVAVVRP